MSNRKNCYQITIPEIDNTYTDCDDFISSKCVIIDNIENLEEDFFSLNDYIESIRQYKFKTEKSFLNLKNSISLLNEEILKLQTEINYLKNKKNVR